MSTPGRPFERKPLTSFLKLQDSPSPEASPVLSKTEIKPIAAAIAESSSSTSSISAGGANKGEPASYCGAGVLRLS